MSAVQGRIVQTESLGRQGPREQPRKQNKERRYKKKRSAAGYTGVRGEGRQEEQCEVFTPFDT